MSYKKYPPDLDGFGWFVAIGVVVLVIVVIVRFA